MFAGPNGSGKSTLKSYLPPELLGTYLNPDEIEQHIRQHGFLDLAAFGLAGTANEARRHFIESPQIAAAGLKSEASQLGGDGDRIEFSSVRVNSYFAAVAGDFIRRVLLARQHSFTFETVMSHPSKVKFLSDAQTAGYRTYLYFVATDDPAINISRVANRVRLGGHPVPEAKIVERYRRSLDLLLPAIRHTNRAYVFDNSGDNTDRGQTWLAEITGGQKLELKTDRIPAWFAEAVLDRLR